MAKIYTDIEAKDFFSHKKVKLDIFTDNSGKVISIQPCEEDRVKLLSSEETVTLPKRIWDKIPYAFKYWNAKNNMEPEKDQIKGQELRVDNV